MAANFRIEAMRFQSFLTWPSDSPMRPERLAAAGFFYSGHADKVECAFCGGHLSQWDQGDNPMTEHRKHYPRCPFVRNSNVGNVPKERVELGNEDLDEDAVPSGVPPRGLDSPWSLDLDDLREDVIQNQQAHNPNYSVISHRIETYRNWPVDSSQTPEVLASAGFYYSGHDDRVTCFYCGGHLNGWTREDDPWVEHARWYPHCNFLRIKKGHEYVNLITKQFLGYGAGPSGPINGDNEVPMVTQPSDQASTSANVVESDREAASSGSTFLVPTPQLVSRQLSATEHSTPSRRIVDLTEEESQDMDHLLEENRHLKQALTCKICMDNEANVAFLPCGHLVCCDDCALPLRNCPMCRRSIEKSVRTYLA